MKLQPELLFLCPPCQHESEAQQEKEHGHSQYENLEIILQFEYLEPFPIYSKALINSQNAIRAQRGTGAKN